jgi:geranylgeranyl diphosphate synthase type II
LQALLSTPRTARRVNDVRWVRRAMQRYDCIEYGRQFAHGLAGAARHEFAVAFGSLPESRDKRFIDALPAWVIERV